MAVAPDFLSQSDPDAAIPDPPDFATYLPLPAIQDAQTQEQGQAWQQQRMADIAGEWTNMAHADLQAQQAQYASNLEVPQAPAPPPDQAPTVPEGQSSDLMSQFFGHLSGLVDNLKSGVGNAASAVGSAVNPLSDQNVATAQANGPEGAPLPDVNLLPSLASTSGKVGDSIDRLTGNGLSNITSQLGNTPLTEAPGVVQALAGPGAAVAARVNPNTTVGDMATMGASMAQPALTEAAPSIAQAGAEALQASHLAPGIANRIADVMPNTFESATAGPGAAGREILPEIKSALPGELHQSAQNMVDNGLIQPTDIAKIAKGLDNPAFVAKMEATKNAARDMKTPWQQAAYVLHTAQQDAAEAAKMPAETVGGQTADELWQSFGPSQHGEAGAPPAPEEAPTQMLGNTPKPVEGAGPMPMPKAPLSFGSAWRAINRGIVQAQMMNPIIHPENVVSALTTYLDPRLAAGIGKDIAFMKAVRSDPEALASLRAEAPSLNIAGRTFSDDIGRIQQSALNDVPILGGLKSVADKATQINHDIVFKNVVQPVQLMMYNLAKRQTGDPKLAAAYANQQMGTISNADRSEAMKWIGDNLTFAGRWTQGTGIQLGATLTGKPTFGGFARDLTPVQQAQLGQMIRGDFLKGAATLLTTHIALNQLLGGKYPWQNDQGRIMNINVTKAMDAIGAHKQGDPDVYIADPFMRRIQDAAHLFGIPGTPLATAMGTTTTQTLVNKLAPLAGVAADVATGSKFISPSDQLPGIQPGPPIVAPGSDAGDTAKQIGAFAVNAASPVDINATAPTRSPEGIKLDQPQLQIGVGPDTSPTAKIPPAAAIAGQLTGARLSTGAATSMLTQQEYQDAQAKRVFGADTFKQFTDAKIQLGTAPNTVSVAGTQIPLTAEDRDKWNTAKAAAVQQQMTKSATKLAGANPAVKKAMLASIQEAGTQAGNAAALKGKSGTDIKAAQAVKSGGLANVFQKANAVTSGVQGPQAPSTNRLSSVFSKANQ